MIMLKDDYYTVSEAAKRLNVSRQTISRWLASGKLDSEKVGRERLIYKKRIWEIELGAISTSDMVWREIFRMLIEKLGYTNEIFVIESADVFKKNPSFLITRRDGSKERIVFAISKAKLVQQSNNKYKIELPIQRVKQQAKRGEK